MKITMLSFGYRLYPENYQDEFYIYHCMAEMYEGLWCMEIVLKDPNGGRQLADKFQGGISPNEKDLLKDASTNDMDIDFVEIAPCEQGVYHKSRKN